MFAEVASLVVVAHGVTGTWLDEIVELGLPIAVFAGLWFWSNRKEKAAKGKSDRK